MNGVTVMPKHGVERDVRTGHWSRHETLWRGVPVHLSLDVMLAHPGTSWRERWELRASASLLLRPEA